jgi:hypothetical protein
MNRRSFIEMLSASGGFVAAAPLLRPDPASRSYRQKIREAAELQSDVVILGGGLGGFAAAMAALRNGLRVILTEETDWIGGQLSQQGVPPDEHQWIESHGATRLYRDFRKAVREYYRQHYPLTDSARQKENLNPGDGAVSRLCHEPWVAVQVMQQMLAPYISSGRLQLLLRHQVRSADVTNDRIQSVIIADLLSGDEKVLNAPYFIDATELGDLLPLSNTEYITGAESSKDTGELHAPDKADPANQQSFTYCFAMDYVPGGNFVADKPDNYDFWRNYVPPLTPPWSGKLLSLYYSNPSTLEPKALGFHPEGIPTGDMLNLWNYRRIISKSNFTEGFYPGDITIVNWPQNDYMLGNLVDVSEEEFKRHWEGGKDLSLALFYWLQTEVPRPDGGQGWPGIRLRGDVMGTEDGLAKYPYVRESRRILAEFTVLEEHVGAANRAMVARGENAKTAAPFFDSVGIGSYHIDLHPSSTGDNYIDFASLPFQIPLGALLPRRMNNLIPANKNIGTTHITNGCYRLHPVEWSIGEAAAMLVAFAHEKKVIPRAVREKRDLLTDFQRKLNEQGVETQWPRS